MGVLNFFLSPFMRLAGLWTSNSVIVDTAERETSCGVRGREAN